MLIYFLNYFQERHQCVDQKAEETDLIAIKTIISIPANLVNYTASCAMLGAKQNQNIVNLAKMFQEY